MRIPFFFSFESGHRGGLVVETATSHLYEEFPFPSPGVDRPLIDVVGCELPFVVDGGLKSGWTVLDAGCGTGHTLIGLARAYPDVQFVGIEPSNSSRFVANGLIERYGVANVRILDAAIAGPDLDRKFDFVYSYGVVHHLPDPVGGMRWLARHTADDGLLHLWLYNAVGESGRMFDRELVQLLTADTGGRGLEVVRALGMSLSLDTYGMPGAWAGVPLSPGEQDVFDADAYLNPVVRPMRFAEVTAMLSGITGWVAADRVYGPRGAPYLDLSGTGEGAGPDIPVVGPRDVLGHSALAGWLDALTPAERVRAIELALRPTGFRVLAGSGASLAWCTGRIRGNVLGDES
jgi:SAM-dependent methyltransferase